MTLDTKQYQAYRRAIEMFKFLVWTNIVLLKFLLIVAKLILLPEG